jgi:2-aminobenzoate-CoA ligase
LPSHPERRGTQKAPCIFSAICSQSARAYSEPILAPTPRDRFIGSPPLAFTFGLGGQLLFPMYARVSTILLEKASPDLLLSAIKNTRQASFLPHQPHIVFCFLN